MTVTSGSTSSIATPDGSLFIESGRVEATTSGTGTAIVSGADLTICDGATVTARATGSGTGLQDMGGKLHLFFPDTGGNVNPQSKTLRMKALPGLSQPERCFPSYLPSRWPKMGSIIMAPMPFVCRPFVSKRADAPTRSHPGYTKQIGGRGTAVWYYRHCPVGKIIVKVCKCKSWLT